MVLKNAVVIEIPIDKKKIKVIPILLSYKNEFIEVAIIFWSR